MPTAGCTSPEWRAFACVCVCTRTHPHTSTHTSTRIRPHLCTSTPKPTCTYLHLHTCARAHTHTQTHTAVPGNHRSLQTAVTVAAVSQGPRGGPQARCVPPEAGLLPFGGHSHPQPKGPNLDSLRGAQASGRAPPAGKGEGSLAQRAEHRPATQTCGPPTENLHFSSFTDKLGCTPHLRGHLRVHRPAVDEASSSLPVRPALTAVPIPTRPQERGGSAGIHSRSSGGGWGGGPVAHR